MREITIYTDGSSLGNPGPGGWGAILISGRHRKEISGGFRLTTNNRMEILALIEALKAIKAKERVRVKLYTDSQYVANTINLGWAVGWQKKGWKKSGSGKAKNIDLWKQLLDILPRNEIEIIWLKGHAGIEENEKCDLLCKAAASQPDLAPDKEYEQEIQSINSGAML